MPELSEYRIHRRDDLARARENLRRHGWALDLVAGLRAEVAATVAGGRERIIDFISETTPAVILFTNCPRCSGNAIHGHYDWDPAEPDVVTCTTCGAQYPDPEYPEDTVFRPTRAGAGQEISYHGGFGLDFRGFSLHSSWSGQIRAHRVQYMTNQLRTLALLYAVTEEAAYGDTAAAILRRFAEVYPNYLVHSGYGEWTDLPPRVAAARLTALPDDEWTVAPNQPDRRLHAGYWMAGRATAVGMEGTFIGAAATAYDLVADRLSTADRRLVEQDLLREGTHLLCADPAFNNKSVTNATAAGLVGLVLDDAGLIEVGTRTFWHFMRRWFLPDGATPESPSYGLMALNPILHFGDALHGRTLPDGTTVDVYGDPAVARVYRNLYDTMLPSLRYPAFADSWVTTTLNTRYADLLVRRYDQPRYRALLRELDRLASAGTIDIGAAESDQRADRAYALLHRDPGFDPATFPDALTFDDVVLPALRLGYLRGGADGLGSTAILSASHWGVHHHRDSLNLTYWDRGHDALSDLGYLWDRTDQDVTVRTAAHNLVVVDDAEQRTDGRGGTVHLVERHGPVAVVRASSRAYAQASRYERTCVLIDHGETDRYLLDVFAVTGGHRHDYLWHGPTPELAVSGIALRAAESGPGYDVTAARSGAVSGPWHAEAVLDEHATFSAWAPAADEQVWIGDGWGERGFSHTQVEAGRTVPYVVRRRESAGGTEVASVFVTAFEVHAGQPIVAGVRTEELAGGGVLVEVTTRDGVDLVVLQPDGGPLDLATAAGRLRTDGELTVFGAGALVLVAGTRAELADLAVSTPAGRSGGLALAAVTSATESHLVVSAADLAAVPPLPATVTVDDGVETQCFPLLDVRRDGDRALLVTWADGLGSPVLRGEGVRWQITHAGLAEA